MIKVVEILDESNRMFNGMVGIGFIDLDKPAESKKGFAVDKNKCVLPKVGETYADENALAKAIMK